MVTTIYSQSNSCGSTLCFASGLGSGMVMQQAPASAAVYGSIPTSSPANTALSVTLASTDGKYNKAYPTNARDDFTWKVIFDPLPAGGNYSITVTCSNCPNTTMVQLTDITFGDIWFCSGQSNMWLPLWFTFDRNATTAAILNGSYTNIRIWRGGLGTTNKQGNWIGPAGPAPGTDSNDALTNQWRHLIDLLPPITPEMRPGEPWLWEFPSTCFYTAQYLTDFLGANAPPIGLMSVPVGGTMVEQWTSWNTQLQCINATCMCQTQGCDPFQPLNPENCTSNSNLYNGNIEPFVNITVKGWLWYQGENNLYADAGNYIQNTGYGCLFPKMIQEWRIMWSIVPQTTDPLAPFAFVTLADGTDEGWSVNMARFRWSQTANFGYVPNDAMPQTAMVSGYDGGDPWDADRCDSLNCCVDPDMPLGTQCVGDHRGEWSVNGTQWFMGAIHPRAKGLIGRRLAQAVYASFYGGTEVLASGPVLAGCNLNNNNRLLVIRFNSTLLGNENVSWSQGVTAVAENTALYVLVNNTLSNTSMIANHHGSNRNYNGAFSNGNEFDSTGWVAVNAYTGPGQHAITVDLSPLNGLRPTAVRYAAGGSGQGAPFNARICCGPTVDVTLEPCAPESCPLKATGVGTLPGLPFVAAINDEGNCECFAPTVCNG